MNFRPWRLVGRLAVLLLLVSASPVTAQTLAWNANSEADIAGYTLLYGTLPGSSSVTLDVGNVTSRTLTGLQPGVPYYFRVRAYNTAGLVSLPSAEVTVTVPVAVDATPPTAPSTLTATASGSTQIALSWSAATDNVGVTGYRVERCTGSGCTTFAQVGTTTATSYSSTGLTASTTYRFRVRAVDAAANAGPYSPIATAATSSSTDTTAPTAPATLTATASGSTQIALSWSAATDNVGVTGYRVERCTGSRCTTFAQVGTTTATSYSSTGLTASTTYRFRVRAVDAAGNAGGYSPRRAATTTASSDTIAPTAPGTLTATAQSATQIALSWSAATDNVGVAGYRVERCTGASCTTFAQVATPTATTYSDTGLTASTTYVYRVRAVDAAGNLGPYSTAASAATTATPPSGCPCTIWPSSAVPAVAAHDDTASVELGVKFQTSVSGYISGVRFFKGTQNTGTHVGNLWSASGTRLATATFVNETASGWQQVNFSTSVAVSAGVTYVASYHAPQGRYAASLNFFATAGVTLGPLTALANSTPGGNGVYRYGASGFPNATFSSANYWVDVVFTTTPPGAPFTALTQAPATLAEASTETTAAASSDASTTERRASDGDGDSLPDAWERRFGLDSGSSIGDDGAAGDPDEDGISNLEEHARGSHPRGVVRRYLAEGLTGRDVGTHLAITNAGGLDATVLVSFSDARGQQTRIPLTVPAGTRRVLDVGAIPTLAAAAFSTILESDQVVTLERSMFWAGSSATTTAPALDAADTRWYFATGSTAGSFELFYLVLNPGDTRAEVQVRYLLPNGLAPVTRTYAVAPFSRATIWVDREDPALFATDVAAEIVSLGDTPIVVERSMYATSAQGVPAEVASGAGLTSAAANWVIGPATGARGSGTTTLVIVNPGAEPVSVEVTSVFAGERREAVTRVVPAGGRLALKLGGGTAGLAEPVLGVEVRSTTGAPIVVERSDRWR